MLVRDIDLFHGLEWHVLDTIANLAQVQTFEKGEILFHQGALADRLFVLEYGSVELGIEGRGISVHQLSNQGDVFGWSSVVEEGRYTSTAVSVAQTRVLSLDAIRLNKILSNHPKAGFVVLRRLGNIFSKRLLSAYLEILTAARPPHQNPGHTIEGHSHSMVPGGLDVKSKARPETP